MKKILLIGKSGQLGSQIVKDAASFNFDVASFGREVLDVTNETQIKQTVYAVKPDILINTSAYHVVPKCEENPAMAMAVNFMAVRNLARICKQENIVFVTYSTDYVFDGEKDAAYEEDDQPNPLQIYGLSKLAGEDAALSVYPTGSLVIRTCGVYGGEKGSPDRNGNFVLNIIKEAQGRANIEVSCEQIVIPTYAGDLSHATLKLLKQNVMPGRYHLVNEGHCSWSEFAVEIFKRAGVDAEVMPVDRGCMSGKMKRPRFSVLKNTKAKALGIELPSWQDGLDSYFKFLNECKNESKN